MKKVFDYLSLFGALSTLLCCALPTLLVALGMGATFVSITQYFPQIHFIGKHKDFFFLFTGLLLFLSYFSLKNSQKMQCPEDVNQRDVCEYVKPKTQKIYWMSVGIFLIGILYSYILPWILI